MYIRNANIKLKKNPNKIRQNRCFFYIKKKIKKIIVCVADCNVFSYLDWFLNGSVAETKFQNCFEQVGK